MIKKELSLIAFLLVVSSFAQNIKTVQLRPKNNPNFYAPIVRLGDVLKLSFDIGTD